MVPEEFNLVINPFHEAFAEVKQSIRLTYRLNNSELGLTMTFLFC